MAATFLCFFIFLIISHIPESSSQSQQNIETVYPFSPPPLPPIVPPPLAPDPPSSPVPPDAIPPPVRSKSTKAAVGRAIGVTAASTVVLSGLLLFLLMRYNSRRKRKETNPSAAVAAVTSGAANGRSNGGATAQGSFTRYGGNVKGLIVDENGLDVLYWRNMEEGENQSGFKKKNFRSLKEEQQEEEKRVVSERERERKSKPPVQEVPLLRGKSSTSQSLIWADEKDDQIIEKAPSFSNGVAVKQISSVREISSVGVMQNGPPPLPPPPGAPWLQPSRLSAAVAAAPAAAAAVAVVAAIPNGKTSAAPPPPPPPIPSNKGPAPPPPPPTIASSTKPPPPDKRSSSTGEASASEKVKLKPLHWDKVNPNVEHSMVWDKIDKGSFK